MKKLIPIVLLAVTCSLQSCFTLIESIASASTPRPQEPTVVVTTVHKPATKPVQTQVIVVNEPDYYRCLDLRAVAAAFAESRSVREFEQLINYSQRYMVSNLDLNRDGWVDYLRVMETMQGWTHVLYVQAVLGMNTYQNVATIVVETNMGSRYVQIIGDPYIYGQNYYINPVFRSTPPMYSYMTAHNYSCWSSPYYWNNYPSYYTHPEPVYISHYEAYVTTYISNHSYCREVQYGTSAHYSNYNTIGQSTSRNDYAVAYPTQSFSARNTGISNARQLTNTSSSSSTSTTTSTSTSVRPTTGASTNTSTRPTTSTSTATNTTTRPVGTSGTSTSLSGSSARLPSTTVNSRVQTNGQARTSVTRVTTTGETTTVTRGEQTSTGRNTTTTSSTSGSRRQ